MSWWIRSSVMSLLGGLLLGGIAGCQSGDEGRPRARPGRLEPASVRAGELQGRAIRSPNRRRKAQPDVTTPARPIDTKQLTRPSRKRSREARRARGRLRSRISGPPSKPELIKDEPLAVTVPAGLAAAHSQDLRSGREPDHQGEVRAGPPALLRSAGLARRHGELRNLPQPGQGLDRRDAGVDRNRRPDRRPQRPDGPQHGLRQDDVLGRPGPVARRPGQGPIQNPIEMGKQKYKEIIDRLAKIPGYTEQFEKVFGTRSRSTAWPRRSRRSSESPPSRATRSTTSTTRATTRPSPTARSGDGPVRPDPEHRRRVQDRRRAAEGQVHALPLRASTSPTSSSTTWASAGTRRPANSPTWAAGRSTRSAPRTTPTSGRSRRRRCATSRTPAPTCTTAAWRRSKRSSSITTRGERRTRRSTPT